MENQYIRQLEKSVVDFLQYSSLGVEDAIAVTFETILKAEQSEFLGYSFKAKPIDNSNKRNGYRSGLVRGLNRVFRIQVPRDRLGNFKPVFLDLLSGEAEEVNTLAFKLYCKGLTTRDVEDVFTAIYDGKYSKSSISRITQEFTEERKTWQTRKLDQEYYAIFIDAIFLPIRRDTVAKEAFYIVLGLKPDLTRDVLAVWNMPQESASGWEDVLKDLKVRGVQHVLNFTADGLTGLSDAVAKVFSKANFQECIVHKQRNLKKKVRSSEKAELRADFKAVFDINNPLLTIEEAKHNLNKFIDKWGKKYYSIKAQFKEEKIDYYFTYLKYPVVFRKMMYTTNWIESLNKQIKRTTKIRGSFPNEDSALNLVCAKIMDICENKYYKYKVSSLFEVQHELEEFLSHIKNT